MAIELGWGKWRRLCLKTFHPQYVERMRRLRRGERNECPHEVLDPRDLKFHRNRGGYHWAPGDDPFRWRDQLPFARVGLAELLLIGGGSAALALASLFTYPVWAFLPAAVALMVAWFFRDPQRDSPNETDVVLAPADGKVVLVEEVEHDDFIGGPAVVIGIFLSIFNVHVNRAPVAARVIGLTYRPGKFFNALCAESARENQQVSLRLQADAAPYRRMVVRQIAGAIARRVVCWVAPGEHLQCGERFGMIKLGSRTELVLPRDQHLRLLAMPGDRVKAGWTILARYANEPQDEPS